jgi:hypothetical protein
LNGHLGCKNDDQRAKKTSFGGAAPTLVSGHLLPQNFPGSIAVSEDYEARFFVPKLCQNQSENSPKTSSDSSPETDHNFICSNILVLIWIGVMISLWHFPKLDVAGSNPVARSERKDRAERKLRLPADGRQCGLQV